MWNTKLFLLDFGYFIKSVYVKCKSEASWSVFLQLRTLHSFCHISEIFAYSGSLLSIVAVWLTPSWEILELSWVAPRCWGFFGVTVPVQSLNPVGCEAELNSLCFLVWRLFCLSPPNGWACLWYQMPSEAVWKVMVARLAALSKWHRTNLVY